MKEPLRVGWLGPHFSGKTVRASKRPEIGDAWELDERAAKKSGHAERGWMYKWP